MEENQFERIEYLLGQDAVLKLEQKTVAIFGVGGVGGYVAEALARTGIGNFVLVDNDVVNITNINRQIIALHSTIGKYKTDVMKDRILDINKKANVTVLHKFYLPDTREEFDFEQYDYIVDAVDTVTAKIDLIVQAKALGKPIISSMGAGNKLKPEAFEVSDIYKTSVCPLAKVMRRELKKRNIESCKVVYSKEEARPTVKVENNKAIPGSIAFVPSVVGLIIAGEVIKDLVVS